MDASVKLGKIWGIPIGLHTSWFLVFGLVSWSLATGYFPTEYPQLKSGTHWLLGVVTSLLFFGSVLAHELGHSFVALRERIPVKGITLFIFGGVAQIGQEPQTPGSEFRIAIAGPLVSLGLSGLFEVLWLVDRSLPILAAPSLYLTRINLMLALFNMIPGFPLDGGRVLRALVWRFTNSFSKASRVAAFSGQIVAFGFIGLGVLTIFSGQFMNGLWLVFIGWFLQNAAASTYAQVNMQQMMIGIKVRQVMNRDIIKVPTLLTINQLIEEKILNSAQRSFFVADNGHLLGMITLKDISAIPQQKWRFTTTEQVMRPYNRLVTINPDAELLSAIQMMDDANVNQLPVIENNDLVGSLSREQIIHYLRLRTQLKI